MRLRRNDTVAALIDDEARPPGLAELQTHSRSLCGTGTAPDNGGEEWQAVPQLAPNAMEEYAVQCAILGDKEGIFEVKIKSNEPVAALKSKIKQENPVTLASVEAEALKLFWVECPVLDHAYSTFVESIYLRTVQFDQQVELDPLCVLSTLRAQEGAFTVGNLHILVDISAGESFNSMPGRYIAEIVSPVLQPPKTLRSNASLDRSASTVFFSSVHVTKASSRRAYLWKIVSSKPLLSLVFSKRLRRN